MPRAVLLACCCLMLLGARRVAAAAPSTPGVLFGQLQVAIVHDKEEDARPSNGTASAAAAAQQLHAHLHQQHYFLLLRNGELKQLLFPREPKQLPRTGARVMVRAAPLGRCPDASQETGSLVCVSSMMARETAPRDVFASNQPQGEVKFKALIMQLQVCGQGPATSPERLEAALFEGLPNSQAQTVEGAFRACSYGNAAFRRDLGSQVVTATVPIPCSGTTPWNLRYDSRTCPYVEWSDVANEHVRGLGYDLAAFRYKIYVVPPGDLCSWGGMGYVGCTSDCRAWISGDLWQYPATWLHELGHNLYMNHAGSYQQAEAGSPPQFVSYKDDSGAMGSCCSTRCYNAPHSFQVGWSKAIDVLHKDNLPAGVWRSYTLPPRQGPGSSETNMLRVLGDWSGPAAAFNLWVEYRRAAAYDVGLLDTVKDRVTVYSTQLGDAMPFTALEAAVGPNQILHESRLNSGLALWVGGTSDAGIRVHVCRPDAANEAGAACSDGRDNDCDGYTDADDADCQGGAARGLQGLQGAEGGPAAVHVATRRLLLARARWWGGAPQALRS